MNDLHISLTFPELESVERPMSLMGSMLATDLCKEVERIAKDVIPSFVDEPKKQDKEQKNQEKDIKPIDKSQNLGEVSRSMANLNVASSESAKEKSASDKPSDNKLKITDYAPFFPRQRKWLVHARPLDNYDLRTGDTIEFRNKFRLLRVKLLDGTQKTIIIDETLEMFKIVEKVCDHLGLGNPEEFSLQADIDVHHRYLDFFGLDNEISGKAKKKSKKERNAQTKSYWLDSDSALPEQGVTAEDYLYLKKKFFFSDQNITRNDPIQVNLVHNQLFEMIVEGDIPCTLNEACQLAALRCQIEKGNYDAEKHDAEFLNLREIVPEEYAKDKNLEKKVFKEYEKLFNLNELNAKYRYIQLCRSIKTYGITFFHVLERMRGRKNKIPVLLGITKESIMRVDVDTKDILKVWMIITLKRWAAVDGKVTFDFGEYAKSYYTVYTDETTPISRLLGGYIKINMDKRRKERGEDDEVRRAAQDMMGASKYGDNGMKKRSPSDGPSAAQQALMQVINSSLNSINQASADMSVPGQQMPISNDPAARQWVQQTTDVSKQTIASQIGTVLASVAAIANMSSPSDIDDVDMQGVGASISTIASSLSQIATSGKFLAGFLDVSNSDKLLQFARDLTSLSGKLLSTIQVLLMSDSINPMVRKQMLGNGHDMSKVAFSLLDHMGEAEVTIKGQEELSKAAKAVSTAITQFVAQGAKPLSQKAQEMPNMQNVQLRIMESVKSLAEVTENLVTCTLIAGPCLNLTACQEQVWESSLYLKDSIMELATVAIPALKALGSQSPISQDFRRATQRINETIASLIDKTKNTSRLGGGKDTDNENYEVDSLLDSLDMYLANLWKEKSEPQKLISNTKAINISVTQLSNLLRNRANKTEDIEEMGRLTDGNKLLTDASATIINATRQLARNPGNTDVLQTAIEAMKEALIEVGGDRVRLRLVTNIAKVVKQISASNSQLVSAINAASSSNRNQGSQMQLMNESQKASSFVAQLVSIVKNYSANPTDGPSQLKLISASKDATIPLQLVVQSGKAAVTTVGDESVQTQLATSIKNLESDLSSLLKTLESAENSNPGLEFSNALQSAKDIQVDIQKTLDLQKNGQLKPNSMQALDSGIDASEDANQAVSINIGQLIAASRQGNEKFSGVAARDIVSSFNEWFQAIKTVASHMSEDLNSQNLILEAALDSSKQIIELLTVSQNLVEFSKSLDSSPEKIENCSKEVEKAHENYVQGQKRLNDLLPGQKDLEIYIKDFAKKSGQISASRPNSNTGDDFKSAKSKFNSATAQIAVANNAISNSIKNASYRELKVAAKKLSKAYDQVIDTVQILFAVIKEKDIKKKLSSSSKKVGEISSKVLEEAKKFMSDPDSFEQRMAADQNVDQLTEALEELVRCVSADEDAGLNKAEQILSMVKDVVKSAENSAPEVEATYDECIQQVTEITNTIGQPIGVIASGSPAEEVGNSVLLMANQIKSAIEYGTCAAFIVGSSDLASGSKSSPSAKLDSGEFLGCAHEVREAVKKLLHPSNGEKEIITCAEAIARNTAQLCDLSREASENPGVNPVSKEQFVGFAKSIATGTASLVQYIKELATDINDDNRRECAQAAKTLLVRVDELVTLSCSMEKTPKTNQKLSPIGIQRMKPFFDTGELLVDGGFTILKALKHGTDDMKKTTSEFLSAIDKFVQFIKSSAPGQKEFDSGIEKIQNVITDLENAITKAESGSSAGNGASAKGDQSFKDALLINVRAISSIIDMLKKANPGARTSTAVKQLAQNFKPTVNNAINLGSSISDKKNHVKLLQEVSALAGNSIKFIEALRDSSNQVEAVGSELEKNISTLVDRLEGSGEGTKELNKVVDNIHESVRKINAGDFGVTIADLANEGITFSVMVQEMTKKSKKMVDLVGQVLTKSSRPQAKVLVQFTEQVSKAYSLVAESAYKTSILAKDSKIKSSISDSATGLGSFTIKMVEVLKSILIYAGGNPKTPLDSSLKTRMTNSVKDLSQALTDLMRAAKDGSKSTAACESAIQTVSECASDLEATKVSAESGQLDPSGNNIENMISLTQRVGKISQEIVVKTKTLVAHAAAGNDEEIANTVKSMASSVIESCECTKNAAILVTSDDKDTQVQVLQLGKAIADDLCSLIGAAMEASGKPMNLSATGSIAAGTMVLPEILKLRDCAKKFVKDNNDLLKNLKSLCEKSSRVANAIESATRHVQLAVSSVLDDSPAVGTSLPGEVEKIATKLSQSLKKLSNELKDFDSSNQESVISCAGNLKQDIENFFRSGKACVYQAPDVERKKMNDLLKRLGEDIGDVFVNSKGIVEGDANASKELQKSCKDFENCMKDLLNHVGTLNPRGYVDLNDPAVVAERELVSLEKSIEAATKKFSEIQKPSDNSSDSDKSFEVQIINGCRAISASSLSLIGGVVQTQRQVAALVMRSPGQEFDSSWANTLVAGTRKVSEAVTDLFESAIMASKGEIQSTRVIVAARNVTSATVGLMTATSSKTNEKAASLIRFRAAAKSVTQASDKLIKIAEQSLAFEEAADVENITGQKNSNAMSRARELDAQARVLQMEQELTNARSKLGKMRNRKSVVGEGMVMA